MSDVDRLQQDLRFVSDAVRRSGGRGVASIYFLWAAICVVGFALPDFSPASAGRYWMVMGPVGFVLSCVLGIRAQRQRGEVTAAQGWRESAHWAATMVVALLVANTLASNVMTMNLVFPHLLLVLGLGYFMAGLHLDRRLIWVGLLLFAGALAFSSFSVPYRWTLFGGLFSGALLISGLFVLDGPQESARHRA